MQSVGKYRTFEKGFLKVLNNLVPLKKTFVRADNTETIIKWSQLESEYLRMSTVENINIYKTLKNYCSKSYKKERKKFYSNLDRKTTKPFLSNKYTLTSKNISRTQRKCYN